MKQPYLISVVIISFALLLLGNDKTLAREDEPPKSFSAIEQIAPSPYEEEPIKGYPVRKRYVGGPTDVEWDLDDSFPKEGSVLEMILRCLDNEDR